MIRSKGEAGTGDVSEATTHMRTIRSEIAALQATTAPIPTSSSSPPRTCRRPTNSCSRSPVEELCRWCCSSPEGWQLRPMPP